MRDFKGVARGKTWPWELQQVVACTVAVANNTMRIYKYTLIHRPRFSKEFSIQVFGTMLFLQCLTPTVSTAHLKIWPHGV